MAGAGGTVVKGADKSPSSMKLTFEGWRKNEQRTIKNISTNGNKRYERADSRVVEANGRPILAG